MNLTSSHANQQSFSILIKLFKIVRAVLRFVMFLTIILCYFISALFLSLLASDEIDKRKKLVQNCSYFSKLILKAFNIHLICKENIPESENSLLVGNHMGFIDIVCLQALRGSVFITSLEMKNTPVLGQITDLGGCAYVDRKNRMNIQDELKGITEVLKQGFRVVLYAESVASNGEQVLPFKKTLLMSAGFASKPIRPFVFNYRKVNSGPIEYSLRDSLCWYGDQTFLPAIWRSLQLDSVECEIEFLPLVQTSPESDRTQISNHLHQQVSSHFTPFQMNMGLTKLNTFK